MNIEALKNEVMTIALEYGPKIIGAVIVWIIGGIVIKSVMRLVTKLMDKRNMDESLKPFLKSLTGALLKTLLAITVLGMLGVEMTSFIAILGAAGLAVGMALSGTLQNFAGGVMLGRFNH